MVLVYLVKNDLYIVKFILEEILFEGKVFLFVFKFRLMNLWDIFLCMKEFYFVL